MKNVMLILIFVLINDVIEGEKIDRYLDVNSTGELEIHNVRGNIEITGWNKNEVAIKGVLDGLTEKLIFNTENNKTLIKISLPTRDSGYQSGQGSRLKIFVPEAFFVQFGGVATDLIFSKINGGIDVSSVSGSINVNLSKSDVFIHSISGEININGVSGNIEVSTVSGNINVDVSSKKIRANGISSNISVKMDNIDEANISTVSGDTDLYGYLNNHGEVSLSNVSGDSYFYVNGELNARVTLGTGPGGDIINMYTDDKPMSSFIGSQKLNFNVGNTNGSVRMSTVSGGIGLRKEKKK